MKRRKFLTVPAAAAGATALFSLEATARTGKAEEKGFRKMSRETLTCVTSSGREFFITHFAVRCPHPAGSRMWMPIADHQGGQLIVATPEGQSGISSKPRRVIFPTVVSGPDWVLEGFEEEGYSVEDRIEDVYNDVSQNGFDGNKPSESGWMVVWVEFFCPDGNREHIIAGLPDFWDPELALDIMEKKRIT